MSGEVPSGWHVGTVGGHSALLNGLAFKPEDWEDRGYPIIRIQNLNGGQDFNWSTRPVAEPYLIRRGQLLFSWSGNRGTSFGPYRWPGPTGILNQHIFRVDPRPETDLDWFFYALDVVRRQVERSAHGGLGLVHVRRGDLLAYEVLTPTLPEQRRIAEILDTLDEAIRKTEQVIAKLQQMKQGLLHDLLTRGIDENGELRDPVRHPEQFKDSPLGRIPKGWDAPQLGDILACSPKNGYSPAESDRPTGVLMLGLGCLTPHGFEPRQLKHAPLSDRKVVGAMLQEGDVLMSRANTRALVGLVGRYSSVGLPCAYPDLMMKLVPSRVISAGFLELTLRASTSRRQIQASAVGTSESMVKISGAIVKRMRIPLPDGAEQQRILDALGRYEPEAAQLNTELSKLRLLKQGLMDDLLTGRVRVKATEAAE